MSLKFSSEKITICENLRRINDILQGKDVHKDILPILKECETMAKKMARKLYEYNKEFDKDWWEANPDYVKNLERRLNENYIS